MKTTATKTFSSILLPGNSHHTECLEWACQAVSLLRRRFQVFSPVLFVVQSRGEFRRISFSHGWSIAMREAGACFSFLCRVTLTVILKGNKPGTCTPSLVPLFQQMLVMNEACRRVLLPKGVRGNFQKVTPNQQLNGACSQTGEEGAALLRLRVTRPEMATKHRSPTAQHTKTPLTKNGCPMV